MSDNSDCNSRSSEFNYSTTQSYPSRYVLLVIHGTCKTPSEIFGLSSRAIGLAVVRGHRMIKMVKPNSLNGFVTVMFLAVKYVSNDVSDPNFHVHLYRVKLLTDPNTAAILCMIKMLLKCLYTSVISCAMYSTCSLCRV